MDVITTLSWSTAGLTGDGGPLVLITADVEVSKSSEKILCSRKQAAVLPLSTMVDLSPTQSRASTS